MKMNCIGFIGLWWPETIHTHVDDSKGRCTHVCMCVCWNVSKVKVRLFLCFLTEHQAMKAYWGSGGIALRIFYLGTTWKWVVSFTHWPLYPQEKSPWYPPDRRLGGPQSRSGRSGEKFPAHAETPTPYHPARSPALYHWAIPAPVCWNAQ
jgi:hypothetical protein